MRIHEGVIGNVIERIASLMLLATTKLSSPFRWPGAGIGVEIVKLRKILRFVANAHDFIVMGVAMCP